MRVLRGSGVCSKQSFVSLQKQCYRTPHLPCNCTYCSLFFLIFKYLVTHFRLLFKRCMSFATNATSYKSWAILRSLWLNYVSLWAHGMSLFTVNGLRCTILRLWCLNCQTLTKNKSLCSFYKCSHKQRKCRYNTALPIKVRSTKNGFCIACVQ